MCDVCPPPSPAALAALDQCLASYTDTLGELVQIGREQLGEGMGTAQVAAWMASTLSAYPARKVASLLGTAITRLAQQPEEENRA